MTKIIRIRIFLFISALICLFGTFVLLTVIFLTYQKTSDWHNGEYDYVNIPPEFAKTYMKSDSDIDNITNMIAFINKQEKGLTNTTINDAKQHLATANTIINDLNIKKGEIIKKRDLLDLYIRVFEYEQTAYTKVDAETLERLVGELSSEPELNKHILLRLTKIVDDYNHLSNYLNTYISKLGEINGDTLITSQDINDEFTYTLKNDFNGLEKFEEMKSFKNILYSDGWSKIIQNNNDVKHQIMWYKAITILEGLNKSDYILLKDIKTLKDVKEKGIQINDMKERDGYDIEDDSLVARYYYDTNEIYTDKHIKKDKLSVDINFKYKKKEKTKPIHEKIHENEDDKRYNKNEDRIESGD